MKRLLSIVFIVGGFAFAFVQLAPLTPLPALWHNADDRRLPDRGEGWRRPDRPEARFRPQGGPPFRGGPGRFGGGGPPSGVQAPLKLVEQFDKNADGWLNAEERKAAREYLEREQAEGRGRRERPGFRARTDREPLGSGPHLTPAEVKNFPDESLYDPSVLRTIFLQFESPDWEKELSDFYHTDVEVPATVTVDGKDYNDIGVHFRGASSFFTVAPGLKRSINLSVDFIHKEQKLYGYRTLNLLNSHEDPTFLHSVLYLQAAREYVPAPKANFIRVVINGESWGVYVNAQQFNKDFLKEWFDTTEGDRWKVPGSPRGRGGLEYLGENSGAYRRIYDIKSKDKKKAWNALIELCRVLNETPSEKLEQELAPLLDIEGALKFLALENALINGDGYWIRASDYYLYRDPRGQFHIIPHDANETYRPPEGPGFRENAPGVQLDPLRGADDPSRALLHRLLAVPAFRSKYLHYIRDVAEKWLDWRRIEPLAHQYQALIATDVKSDVHKLYSSDSFTRSLTEEIEQSGNRGTHRLMSLKDFVEQRQQFLLNHPAIKQAGNGSL